MQTSLLAGGVLGFLPGLGRADVKNLRIAPFRYDVTPPMGHPLCGGWITPAQSVEDSLEAIGYVLLGAGAPVVVCAVDWTGILNGSHLAWREALAKAAGTTPERVAVQCVHQHDAPFACTESERLMKEHQIDLTVVDEDFFQTCLERGSEAVKQALAHARPVTHVATGEAKVDRVAANRRVDIGPDGKIKRMRGSSCRVPELVEMEEGLIDPMLKTVAFYHGEEKLVACHYYATHPMSHYGKGHISSDFVGLARKQRQQEEPGCTQIYFTGCAGNVAAGKYNDGSQEAREQLTGRIHEAMVASEKALVPQEVTAVSWTTHEVLPEVNQVFTEEGEMAHVLNAKIAPANRIRPAMRVSWIRRIARKQPIVLSALHVNNATLLHMPAESFVEYQLRAQQLGEGRFVATAAYGDGGPWYIPVKEAFPQGGYEVSVANCQPEVDDQLTTGIKDLLARA